VDVEPSTTRRSLTLPGPFELLAEPDVGPGPATRVRLGSSPVQVVLPASGRLEIGYRVSSRDVGQSVTVKAGGTTSVRRLAAAGGTLRVDRVGSGPVAVSIETGNVRGLFLASGAGRPPWQVRRVWALPDLGEMRLPIPAGTGSISVDVYRAGDEGVLSWSVEELGETPPGLSPDLLAELGGGAADAAAPGDGPSQRGLAPRRPRAPRGGNRPAVGARPVDLGRRPGHGSAPCTPGGRALIPDCAA
jgi:hypothetical protein